MADCPAAHLATLMRDESESLLKVLAENVEALVGQSVEFTRAELDSKELAQAFGSAQVYIFPVEDHQSQPLPSLLAIDLPGAVHLGAAFSLMGPEQIREVLDSGEVPEILHDSIGEVANILCGAAVNLLREKLPEAPEYRRGAEFELAETKPWPGLFGRSNGNIPWDIVAGQLKIGGEDKGWMLLGASDQISGAISAKQILEASGTPAVDAAGSADADSAAAAPASASESAAEGATESAAPAASALPTLPEGMKVHLSAHPADPGAFQLRKLLDDAGLVVQPAHGHTAGIEALFVISRSPTDLRVRLASHTGGSRRPPLLVAASDRPTKQLVIVARAAGVDNFLVLPTSVEQLAALFESVAQPV